MKLFTTTQIFIAKQIIDHKMPKIDSEKWTTRRVNIGGKWTTVSSRNQGSYFNIDGINYYVATGDFKEVKSVKTKQPPMQGPPSPVVNTTAE